VSPPAPADRGRIAEELAALVAIPSISGDEEAVQAELARRMEADGLRVERIDTDPEQLAADPAFPGYEVPHSSLPIVAGHLAGSRPGPRILLSGHVDVVPPGDPSDWTTPAFEPVVRDGALHGRGACDMKGGLVAALEAARLVAGSGVELAGELVVLAVPAEEDGGAGSLAAIRAGYTGAACVITEPTRLEVVVAHAGAITFTLDVPGRAAHASMRREGVSALDKLGLLVAALAADERRRNAAETDPLMTALGLPYPTMVGRVEGGHWASTVMDRVVAHGRYGVRLGQDCDGAAEELGRAVGAAWEADDFLAGRPVGLSVWGGRFDSARVPADHPLPVGLAAAGEAVLGRRPPLVGVPYGADMRLFVNEGSTPTVMFGPGDVRVAHAADERVDLEEVAACAEVLARWVVDTLGR
jgi:acetylornithine deacetylase